MSISDSSKPDVEKMKLEKDVEGLIKALKYDGDWKVRWIVASALEEIGGVRAVDALVRALKDEDVQEKATMALVKKGEAAVELLIQALKDKDWEVRWRATSVL
ncbi:MAG: HEAT repeat domain-containing protein, partial [Candidatus Hodarchaeota archaeon]